MYRISSALTVCQSSANSFATSAIATAPPDKIRKALGVERIVGQKLQPLTLHLAAVASVNAPHLQFQKYPRVPA